MMKTPLPDMTKRRRWLTLVLVALGTLTACVQADEKFRSFTVGFSTPSGHKIWVSNAHFDGRWSVPVGSMACCWEEVGKGSSITDKPLPHEIYVNWEEAESKKRYEATVKLVDDLAQKAKRLPGYLHIPTQRKDPGSIYLIVGLAPHGKVTVWLSNTTSSKHREGRILEVVGETQGTVTQDTRPYYPTRKD